MSERQASSSTGSGTPGVSTQCWRRWAGLLWSNDARLADCRCSTKSRVALHIAPPWKPNWLPSHHINYVPMTHSSPCWPPEPSIEAPPPSPKTIRDWNSLPMEVVEAPTLGAFMSRVSNWTITYSITPTPSHVPEFFIFLFFSSADHYNSKHPSYRCQNNRHIDCGPLNERRRQLDPRLESLNKGKF